MKVEHFLIIAFALLLILLPICVCPQDAQPDPLLLQQTNLSSAVRQALQNSRQSMTDLETSSKIMTDRLQSRVDAQSVELMTLSADLTNTMNSFRALSGELENSNQQLGQEKEKVRVRNKALLWFGIIGGIIILGKIAAFILYAKRVPMPRWLDIIL
jgi:uncharacterized integral membrane protein